MEQTVLIFIGFIVGIIIGYLISKKITSSGSNSSELDSLKLRNEALQVEKDSLINDKTNALVEKGRVEAKFDQLEKSYSDLRINIQQVGESYKTEFQNMANNILEAKSKSFEESNTKNLKIILDPLNKDIKEFKDQVQKVYTDEAKERHSLGDHIKNLVETSTKVSQQAENLTNALKGNVKQQGNWGEMILSSILENSGLTENREYFLQEFIKDKSGEIIKDDNGNSLQPDVTIHYPDTRKVIIDSKVSLIAWEQYVSENDVVNQKNLLEAHIKSLKIHIDGLSKKNYPKYAKALDHVIMFIPIEPAFLEAVKKDTTLWKYAYDKKVLLVGPTNLLLVLKIIADMWQIEKQSKNAVAIAEKAGELYDKLFGFVETMDDLGSGIKKASDSFEKAMGQLTTGRGNAIKKAEELKILGADTKKQFPDRLIDDSIS